MKVSFQKKETDPNMAQGMKIPYAPAKRNAAQWRWYLILLIVTSPLLYFLSKMALSFVLVNAQGFVSLEHVALNSSAYGVLQTLSVQTGQDVSKGEVVARLYNPQMQAQKALLEFELAASQQSATLLDLAQQELTRKRLNLAKEILNSASDYLKNVRFLIEQGAATMAELNQAEERRNRAQMAYNQIMFEYRKAQENGNALIVAGGAAAAESARKQIQNRIHSLEQEQALLDQVAPYSGRILDVFAVQGQNLAPGAPILLLGRSEKPSVIAYLEPKYAKYARHGRMATVKLPDGQTLEARVRQNANLAKRLPADLSSPIGSRDLMLLVNLELLSPLPDIQWVDGLPVSVRFH